jgi:hypothetical protein
MPKGGEVDTSLKEFVIWKPIKLWKVRGTERSVVKRVLPDLNRIWAPSAQSVRIATLNGESPGRIQKLPESGDPCGNRIRYHLKKKYIWVSGITNILEFLQHTENIGIFWGFRIGPENGIIVPSFQSHDLEALDRLWAKRTKFCLGMFFPIFPAESLDVGATFFKARFVKERLWH